MVRFKYRYFLTELQFESDFDRKKVLSNLDAKYLRQEVKTAIKTFFGDYGLACVHHSLSVKYINVMTQVAIIRCCREHHRTMWSTLTMMNSLGGRPCKMTVLHLAGTIRSCQKFLAKHNQKILKELIRNAATPVEKKQIQELYQKVLKAQRPLRT